jgi:hypothetical protein
LTASHPFRLSVQASDARIALLIIVDHASRRPSDAIGLAYDFKQVVW